MLFRKAVEIKPSQADNYIIRVERALRLSVAANGALLAAFLVTLGSTVYLATRPKDPPILVNFKPDTAQIVELQPGSISASDLEKTVEVYFRLYVSNREMIDNKTEAGRYETVRLMSTPEEWQRFNDLMMPAVGPGVLKKYADGRMIREIHITNAGLVPGTTSIYRVEFTAIDRKRDDHSEISRRNWSAEFNFFAPPMQLSRAEALKNPLSLQVDNYTLRAR